MGAQNLVVSRGKARAMWASNEVRQTAAGNGWQSFSYAFAALTVAEFSVILLDIRASYIGCAVMYFKYLLLDLDLC